MRAAGIDIGSRTVKLVSIFDGKIEREEIRENTFNPLALCGELLGGESFDSITATGYGRHLFTENFGGESVSEIKAFAKGVSSRHPATRTILDIGGQDTKVIALDQKGKILKFDMNDKCAAGTGKFLEIMAMALGLGLNELGPTALTATASAKINSMCTVFAESEVISSIARGVERESIAKGLHLAVIERAKSLLERVVVKEKLVFVGGVALNPAIKQYLEIAIGMPVHTPPNPQAFGALGAALLSWEKTTIQ